MHWVAKVSIHTGFSCQSIQKIEFIHSKGRESPNCIPARPPAIVILYYVVPVKHFGRNARLRVMKRAAQNAIGIATLAGMCILAAAQTSPADSQPLLTAGPPSQPVAASPQAIPLADQIAAILATPAVTRDHWGIQVTTLDGMPLYSLNEAQLFQPASNAKLFTTAMALTILGEDERFETPVIANGNIDKNGVLHGDLALVGGGDPSFGTRDLPYISPGERPKTPPPAVPGIADIEELADKVYASGLRRVEGNVLGDDWRFIWDPYPPDWDLDDLVFGYGAPVSALSLHDNEIELKISPSTEGRPAIQTDPDLPYYSIDNEAYNASPGIPRDCGNDVGYLRAQGTKTLVVFGSQPNQTPCKQAIAIADPAEYAAMAFKAALERRGIQVTGTAQAKHMIWRDTNPATSVDDFVPNTMKVRLTTPYVHALLREDCMAMAGGGSQEGPQTTLAAHKSEPLSEEIKYTMKESQNLHAEILLRDTGAALGCSGTQRAALNALRIFLSHTGIAPTDFALVDGSGLSSHDLVTSRAIAKLLSYAAHDPKTGQPQPWFAVWKSSLPVGGEDGTLASRFPAAPLKDHIFAKTGTLSEARALSGYLDAASGRTVIFSILVGNHLPGTSDDREAMDKIVAAIQASE